MRLPPALRVVLASGAVLASGVALAPEAAAQPADSAQVAQAQALLASGDARGASRIVRPALRESPEDARWLTLMLQLRQEGIGLFGQPPFARRNARRLAAERLLRADSTSPHAHDELGRQRLETYLFDRDLMVVHGMNGQGAFAGSGRRPRGDGPTDAFNRNGRYDLARLRQQFPVTQKPGMERAREEAEEHLQAAARYGGEPFAEPLATLLVAEQDWEGLLTLADTVGAGLWRAAALYRMGRVSDSDAAYEAALAGLPESVRRDLDDPSRADPNGSHRDDARFWAERDVLLITQANERVLEHRTRVVEADVLFGWRGQIGRDEPRGTIYIRYGTPAERATLNQPFYPGDSHSSLGGATASHRFEVWEYASGLRYVFSDPVWSGDYAVYAPSARAFSADARSADADDYISQDERLRRLKPDASQFEPAVRIPVDVDIAQFRGPDGQTDLVVASGVRLSDSLRAALDGGLRTGVYVLRGGSPEARVEREASAPTPLVQTGDEQVWPRAASLTVSPGEVEIAAEVASGAEAAGWVRETVQVRSFGGGFSLSDVVLAYALDEGRPARPSEVRRGETVIQPAPWARFESGAPVGLYAEVYGLDTASGEARYTVEAALVPRDGRPGIVRAIGGLFGRGTRRGVSVSFEATSPTASAPLSVLLDASRQRPGAYTLRLTVTDAASGDSVQAEREVTLE